MSSRKFNIPRLIGHRGIAGRAPENTLEGFRRAKAAGVECVEFDVMLTADKVAILMHDPSLKRTTGVRGQVGNTDYADLASLDAGSWFSPAFKGEHIPRFTEAIALLGELELQANIEIKPYRGADILTAQTVLKTVASIWPKHLPLPLISSFSYEAMLVAHKQAPAFPRGLCVSRWMRQWRKAADALECVTVHLPVSAATAARVEAIHQTGRGVLVYTVNEIKKARELYALGVDGLFSDYPDKLAQAIKE